MNHSPQQLFAEAMEMPSPDRGRLAAMLIHSLETETGVHSAEDHAAEEWSVEIQSRIAEIDQGSVQLIPWQQVRGMMRGEDAQSD